MGPCYLVSDKQSKKYFNYLSWPKRSGSCCPREESHKLNTLAALLAADDDQ